MCTSINTGISGEVVIGTKGTSIYIKR